MHACPPAAGAGLTLPTSVLSERHWSTTSRLHLSAMSKSALKMLLKVLSATALVTAAV